MKHYPKNFTGTFTATSWQQKTVRPIVTINGLVTLNNSAFDQDNQLLLYPNPATSVINLGKTFTVISVYDLLGKVILTATDADKVAISSLSKGTYIIKVTDEAGNQKTSQFLKN